MQNPAQAPALEIFENSIGLGMVKIPFGNFMMGHNSDPNQKDLHWDDGPAHLVEITYDFFMSKTEITNIQYEQFDPSHKKLRGNGKDLGFSQFDDEAVVNVSYDDATAFCAWLSEKEGKHYRLPTEAEWEYACRAGTTSKFWTGENLPKEMQKDQILTKKWNARIFYKKHDLRVGETSPNAFGLYDMHGNVENWCYDKFGHYTGEEERDPVYLKSDAANGGAFVTRGGSYGVLVDHLRSARRLGALRADKHWLIGFRVVCAPLPENGKTSRQSFPSYTDSNVDQSTHYNLEIQPELKNAPYYLPPIRYINPQAPTEPKSHNITEPIIYPHNHCPAITWCSNGDLLAIWFSTYGEHDRDMIILGTRLRKGKKEWGPASFFFRVPGRNTTGSSLMTLPNGDIIHTNGIEVASSWKTLIWIKRVSHDNGYTWSEPEIMDPHQSMAQSQLFVMDLSHLKMRSSNSVTPVPMVVEEVHSWKSIDNGNSFQDLGRDADGRLKKKPLFWKGIKGNWIAGIHAKAVELSPNTFLAFGRANAIRMKMPQSYSEDGGKTWKYKPNYLPINQLWSTINP